MFRLFLIFLKIGVTTWGGFMTFIAVVSRSLTARNLVTEADITDAILVASVLPGPVAVDMTVAIGYRLRGLRGAAVCWLGSVLPSFVVVTALGVAYLTYGSLPAVNSIFQGFPAAMVAIVASAAFQMGRNQIKNLQQIIIAALAALAIIFIPQWWVTFTVVLAAGLAGWLLYRDAAKPRAAAATAPQPPRKTFSIAPFAVLLFPVFGAAIVWKIFATFAVMSLTLFGSGYVFIPIIKNALVGGLGWLTAKEFTAGLALTQITPGPILMTSAFVGLKVAGIPGALAGMLGMFVPPALLTVVAAHSLQAIKDSSAVTAALRGVRPAVVGMIFAASIVVGQTMPHDTPLHLGASLAILAGALLALFRFKIDVALIIPLAGAAGFVLFR